MRWEISKREKGQAAKMFSFFIKAATSEMQLAASVMENSVWHDLSKQLNLIEGYTRLAQMEAARQELSHTLSRVTTLGAQAMASLQKAGLL